MNFGEFLDLSQYQKLDKIGHGSFGIVYKARKQGENIIYAAKVSLDSYSEEDDDRDLMNLRREININAQLNHPCVLKFIGYSPIDFNNESNPVIITEYAANGSLSSILKQEKASLSPPEWNATKKLINIFGIASAMSYLHYHNILHRDLKPGNILEDENFYPKVADFGLSKKIHTNPESMTPQSSSGVKGTHRYIPPEIWKDHEYTKSGDVYSFSLIVYEIITGIAPLEKFTVPMMYGQVVCRNYRPEFKTPIPYCFRSLITRCWTSDPSKRPTFEGIVDELKSNEEFLKNGVNKNEFFKYVKFVENSFQSFDPRKKYTSIVLPAELGDKEVSESSSRKSSHSRTSELSSDEKIELEKIVLTKETQMIVDDQFNGCLTITQITIPSSVTSIGKNSFYGCSRLSQISFASPSSLDSIGESSFENCSSLSEIIIPSSVTLIGKSAFNNCTSLLKIEFEKPYSLTSIKEKAFMNCSSLEKIAVPYSLKSVGIDTFKGCQSLKFLSAPNCCRVMRRFTGINERFTKTIYFQ